jgi:ferredoxin
MSFHVVVDGDVCENNGVCTTIAPALFALGDDDNEPVTVLQDPVDDQHRATAEHAVRACPKQAITLVSG